MRFLDRSPRPMVVHALLLHVKYPSNERPDGKDLRRELLITTSSFELGVE